MQYDTRDALLAQSDILSLHCPTSAESYHLLDAAAFDTMKRGMILINTACALLSALDQSHVAAAGLDFSSRKVAPTVLPVQLTVPSSRPSARCSRIKT